MHAKKPDACTTLRHGHWVNRRASPTWNAWFHARRRCQDKTNNAYPYYGGRGIKVCERWKSFDNFLADMGIKPKGTQLDRINNDGDYEPSNCRWATKIQQMNNTRHNIWLTLNGETLTLIQWSRKLGINYKVLKYRASQKWDAEKILTRPIGRWI